MRERLGITLVLVEGAGDEMLRIRILAVLHLVILEEQLEGFLEAFFGKQGIGHRQITEAVLRLRLDQRIDLRDRGARIAVAIGRDRAGVARR